MSRTLLVRDNISVSWEILGTREQWDVIEQNPALKLTFNLLVNGKLKVWGTTYELDWEKLVYKLKLYHAWNDLKDLLSTIWYDLSDVNIDNWVEEFEI